MVGGILMMVAVLIGMAGPAPVPNPLPDTPCDAPVGAPPGVVADLPAATAAVASLRISSAVQVRLVPVAESNLAAAMDVMDAACGGSLGPVTVAISTADRSVQIRPQLIRLTDADDRLRAQLAALPEPLDGNLAVDAAVRSVDESARAFDADTAHAISSIAAAEVAGRPAPPPPLPSKGDVMGLGLVLTIPFLALVFAVTVGIRRAFGLPGVPHNQWCREFRNTGVCQHTQAGGWEYDDRPLWRR
jgi:hypothetical protein